MKDSLNHWDLQVHDTEISSKGVKLYRELGEAITALLLCKREIDSCRRSNTHTTDAAADVTGSPVNTSTRSPLVEETATYTSSVAVKENDVPNSSKLMSELESKADKCKERIAKICSKLEMVHRASVPVLESFFNKIGLIVLPLLTRVLNRFEVLETLDIDTDALLQENEKKHEADVAVEANGGRINRHQSNGVTPKDDSSKAESHSIGPTAVEIQFIESTIKIISYFSQCESSRYPIITQNTFVTSIADISGAIITDPAYTAEVRVHLVGTLANLSMDANCVDHMIVSEALLENLLLFAKDENDDVSDLALVALSNMASSERNCKVMASNKDITNTVVSLKDKDTAVLLLSKLTKYVHTFLEFDEGTLVGVFVSSLSGNKQCGKIKLEILRTFLSILQEASDSTVEMLASQDGLLNCLSQLVMLEDNISCRTMAAMILKNFSKRISPLSENHKALLNALYRSSESLDTSFIAEALEIQSMKVGSRKLMMEYPGLLATLVDMAGLEPADFDDPLLCKIRKSAIGTINGLATKSSNRAIMSKDDKLILALVKASQRESKEKTKSPSKQTLMKIIELL